MFVVRKLILEKESITINVCSKCCFGQSNIRPRRKVQYSQLGLTNVGFYANSTIVGQHLIFYLSSKFLLFFRKILILKKLAKLDDKLVKSVTAFLTTGIS